MQQAHKQVSETGGDNTNTLEGSHISRVAKATVGTVPFSQFTEESNARENNLGLGLTNKHLFAGGAHLETENDLNQWLRGNWGTIRRTIRADDPDALKAVRHECEPPALAFVENAGT